MTARPPTHILSYFTFFFISTYLRNRVCERERGREGERRVKQSQEEDFNNDFYSTARKQQQAGASRDFELMSFRRSFGGGSYDRDHHTLKRHVSCPPLACSPPDTPASVLVMPYQRPLPLSSDGMTYRGAHCSSSSLSLSFWGEEKKKKTFSHNRQHWEDEKC